MAVDKYYWRMIDWRKVRRIIVYSCIALIIILLGLLAFRFFGGEDSWIKNEKGAWIMHGNPAIIPAKVREQQNAISCASELYASKSLEKTEFSSQCLGKCGDYVVDIVHVPRKSEDNLQENQCSEFRLGEVKNFIELDKEGRVVRIVD